MQLPPYFRQKLHFYSREKILFTPYYIYRELLVLERGATEELAEE